MTKIWLFFSPIFLLSLQESDDSEDDSFDDSEDEQPAAAKKV